MKEPNEILAQWRLLGANQKNSKGPEEMPSIETDTVVSGGKVRLAITNQNLCALLLPISITELAESDQMSDLISIRPVVLGHKGKDLRFVEVRCEDERLNEVFARVVSDILRRIESGITGLESIDEALDEFRRLLNKPHKSSPDEMTIVGLIGELLILIEILKINPNGLLAWHGPDYDRHDFRAGTVTVEVKTSLGADGNRVHINGIRQLENVSGDTLLMRHIRIEPDPDGSLSVPDLVSQAATLIADRAALDEKLDKQGYNRDNAESWQSRRYRKFNSTAYEVRDGFPRLLPELLNVDWPLEGVSAVSYEIDLGAASECRVTEEIWQAKIKELCGCL